MICCAISCHECYDHASYIRSLRGQMDTHTNATCIRMHLELCKGRTGEHTQPYMRPCIHVHACVVLPAFFFRFCGVRSSKCGICRPSSSASPHRTRIQNTDIQSATEYPQSLKHSGTPISRCRNSHLRGTPISRCLRERIFALPASQSQIPVLGNANLALPRYTRNAIRVARL